MQKILLFFFYTIFHIAFSGAILHAQKRDTAKQITEIDAVAFQKKIQTSIIPPQTLSGETLEKLNNHNVADALRYFSGVQIKDYGGVGGLRTVNIRSMGSQHVGVFYDGIQLGNAQNGVVDLGKFSLDDIEEISLYNGQKSEIFQPAKDFGSSGSIYLQPRKPQFKNNETTHIMAKVKSASILTFNPSVRWEQKLSKKLTFSLSSEYLETDGLYKFRYNRKYPNGDTAYDTIAKRTGSDVKSKRFEASINGELKDGKWDIRGYGFIIDRGLPSPIVRNRFPTWGQRMKEDNLFVQGSIQKKIFPKMDSQFKAKFAYDYMNYVDTLKGQSVVPVNNVYIQREAYFSTSHLYKLTKNWEISAAGDFQYNNLDANMVNFSYPTRYTFLTAFATSYQWNRVKAQASILGTFVHEKVELNSSSPDKNEWTPTFFLRYQPFTNHNFYVNGFYKRVFRMPTFNDLYYTLLGNSALKPEYTTQYDLGFEYHLFNKDSFFKELSVKVDTYYNKVKDKIVAMPSGNSFRWTMLNLGEVEILGIDVNINSTFNIGETKVTPLLNYTYQRARDFTDREDSFFGDQIPYTPRHNGTFSLMTDYKSWSFNYSFIYVGERYDGNQDNIAYNYVQPWYTHDLSVQKQFDFKKYKFKATLEMNNVLNQYYDVVLNYPMPGRNFRFILSFNL